jgi:hypothetical protein
MATFKAEVVSRISEHHHQEDDVVASPSDAGGFEAACIHLHSLTSSHVTKNQNTSSRRLPKDVWGRIATAIQSSDSHTKKAACDVVIATSVLDNKLEQDDTSNGGSTITYGTNNNANSKDEDDEGNEGNAKHRAAEDMVLAKPLNSRMTGDRPKPSLPFLAYELMQLASEARHSSRRGMMTQHGDESASSLFSFGQCHILSMSPRSIIEAAEDPWKLLDHGSRQLDPFCMETSSEVMYKYPAAVNSDPVTKQNKNLSPHVLSNFCFPCGVSVRLVPRSALEGVRRLGWVGPVADKYQLKTVSLLPIGLTRHLLASKSAQKFTPILPISCFGSVYQRTRRRNAWYLCLSHR